MLGIAVLGFVIGMNIPVFSVDNLKSSSIPSPFKELLDEEKINLFLKLTSGNYQIIRDESGKINKLTIPKYERYEFNPLFKYPIVRGDSRFLYYSSFQFVVPNAMLLLKKIAQGVYWDLRDNFAKLNSQTFLNQFGEAFENYCGDILKIHFGEENVKRVKDIIGKELQDAKKHADWIACDDQNLYIFEFLVKS